MTTHHLEDWEKEFIRGFVTYEKGIESNPILRKGLRQEDVLSFIRSLIQERDTKLREKIKALESDKTGSQYLNGYNVAIYEVLDLFKPFN